jgi:hypothetical protein
LAGTGHPNTGPFKNPIKFVGFLKGLLS